MELALMNDTKEDQKYNRAKKQMIRIKCFYKHAKIYVIVNLMLLIAYAIVAYKIDLGSYGTNVVNWVHWNVVSSPTLWGLVLIIHGLIVFKFRLPIFEKWEERKIRELMDQEQENSNRKN